MKGYMMVLDCETGGLNKNKNPITQFAGIIIDENFKEINRWNTFVRPYKNLVIEKKALELTMVTMSQINKGIALEDFVKMLIEFAKQARTGGGRFVYMPTITGHNVSFDIAFLRKAFEFCGQDLSEHFDSNNGEIVRKDTQEIAELKWPKFKHDDASANYKLTTCCKNMGIKLNDAHGAMNDTVATWKLLKAFSDDLSTDKAKFVTNSTAAQESEEEIIKPRKFWRF